MTIFSYSLCPFLEGTKDMLCYKSRRLTIGQNCRAVCTNKSGHRDAFLSSNEWCEAPHFKRPAQQATEPHSLHKDPRIQPILTPAAHTLRDSARPRTFYIINMYLYYYTIYNEKYFSERPFSHIVRVLTWRAQKMRSSTSSEGS